MNTDDPVSRNIIVSSKGKELTNLQSEIDNTVGATIENHSGFDIMKFEIRPGSSLITNQDTMSYMDGGLSTTATTGSTGLLGAMFRGIAGASILQNRIQNTTNRTLSMVLSPLLQGSIVQVNIQVGETWRFSDRSFLACTPNLQVSGNLNLFSNFKMLFVSENITYITVTAKESAGVVWISAHGACEIHTIRMGEDSSPFYINNGCFLGMLDQKGPINYYNDYVHVGLASSMMQSVFTDLGFVMKIQDTKPPKRSEPVECVVLTQSLNPQNLEKFISKIVENKVNEATRRKGASDVMSMFGGTEPQLRKRNMTKKNNR